MKAVLIDDEALSLERLKEMLKDNIEGIEVVGTYLDPLEGDRMMSIHQPDIVFLDIEMPELNGLLLAERIQEVHPNTAIIFVTGYDRYAVDAFELYAIDYIMKPIQLERLEKTVTRLQSRFRERHYINDLSQENPFRLGCFNALKVMRPNGEIETMKWRTAKAQELFAYLLHHRNQIIYRDTLIGLLWADFDVTRGAKQLYTTIYHIRQTLKKYGIDEMKITSQSLDKGYRLDSGTVHMDTEMWEEQLKKLNPLGRGTIEEYERLVYAYQGDYLGEYDYVWAEGERERLRSLWFEHAERLSAFYCKHDMTSAAIKVNEQIQKVCPIEENSYYNLMKLYASLNKKAIVEGQYAQLILMMEEQLDSIPSPAITFWYGQWMQKES